MTGFNRGLGDNLRKCLISEPPLWWKDVVKHPDLSIAIRDNYLNVYHRGQSIFKVWYQKSGLVGQTHFKYLIGTPSGSKYRMFSDDKFDIDIDMDKFPLITKYEGVETLKQPISNAGVYALDEKNDVYKLIRKPDNGDVIDLEIALSTGPRAPRRSEEEAAEAESKVEESNIERIDIAALEEASDGSVSVVFYEVKRFSDPRIWAKGEAEVIGQLSDYKTAVRESEAEIKQAYFQVCSDLVALKRSVASPNLTSLIQKVAGYSSADRLRIEPVPRLVVIGIDAANKRSKRWKEQLEKLSSKFPVQAWADARDVLLQREAWANKDKGSPK